MAINHLKREPCLKEDKEWIIFECVYILANFYGISYVLHYTIRYVFWDEVESNKQNIQHLLSIS